MKAAVIQYKAEKGRAEASLDALGRLIAAAGEQGAEVIVCPEMALTGYLFSDRAAAAAVAEPVRGGSFEALSGLAGRYGAYLVCGYLERGRKGARGERLYNSARVIGPDGKLLANYRKRLLYDSDYAWAEPGDTPYPLIDAAGGRLSVGICMDLNDDRFTEFLRHEAPRLLCFCTNWLDEGVDILPYWRLRLYGTRGYFLAANTYGSEEATGHPFTRFCGGSAILAPGGHLVARGPKEGDAVVLAELPDV